MEHICSLCPYMTENQDHFLSHLVKRHKNCSNFIVHCSAPGCGASFRNHSTFVRHCYRKHFFGNNGCKEPDLVSNDCEDDDALNSAAVLSDSAKDEAAFILKLTAQHKLSRRGIMDV